MSIYNVECSVIAEEEFYEEYEKIAKAGGFFKNITRVAENMIAKGQRNMARVPGQLTPAEIAANLKKKTTAIRPIKMGDFVKVRTKANKPITPTKNPAFQATGKTTAGDLANLYGGKGLKTMAENPLATAAVGGLGAAAIL